MKPDVAKIRKWVGANLGIDPKGLSDADVVKVANYMLRCDALELPRLAERHAAELGLPSPTEKTT